MNCPIVTFVSATPTVALIVVDGKELSSGASFTWTGPLCDWRIVAGPVLSARVTVSVYGFELVVASA